VTVDTGVADPALATAEKGADFFRKVTHKIADYLVALATTDTDDLYD
jgi:creatinine amidohydrolase